MLQPNQPMGTPNMAATGPQAPKPAMPGMPQQGKPQGTPAGALIGMMPQGGIMAPIDKVADAYRGNPQALAQKADVGNDLLAALAKQRLEAKLALAQRELQMETAGQQDPNQKTVIEQLDDRLLQREMDGLTKQEMQREQMDTLKQKQGQIQQGQQRLMQAAMNPQAGLPGLPAPNAAEPKAMAAGGIVAFAGNDPQVGSYVDPKEYSNYDPSNPAHLQDRLESERERIKAKYGFDPESGGLSGGIGTRIASALGGNSEEVMALERYRAMKEGAKTAQQAPNRPTAPTPVSAPAAAPASPAAAPAAPSAPAAPGGAPSAPAAGGLNSLLQGAVKQGLSSPEDRTKAAEAERARALEFIGFSPEDEAKRRQGIAALEDIDKARFDPERMGRESFARMLGGAANQSFVGGIGAGMTRELSRAEDEQYRQQREATAQRNKAFEDLIGKTQEIKKEAYGAGQKKEDIMSKDFQQSLASGSAMRNADVAAAVSAMNAAATRETAAAMRDQNNFQRLQGALTNVNRYREAARQKVLEQYPQFGGLAQMDPTKMDKSQKAEFDRLRGMVAKDIEIATKGFDEQAAALEERLGYSGKGAASGQPAGTVDKSNPLLSGGK